eukprot:TRINITY_DN37248_c0_g1_i1.p1 TRINITY_DN37248_c0_g1~~TRINITY_DN37248_c0_g1_i1.p1  ORF type:complete len:617 (+),score=196.86 TRINITY_DN37248_c0_g1_i1:113-1963(+)
MPPSAPPSGRGVGSARRAPSADAAGLRAKAAEGGNTYSAVAASVGRAARPRSATPSGGSRSVHAADAARNGSDKVMAAWKNACAELKTTANQIDKENTKARTRLMALERELQKRERLLRQLVLLSQNGQGIGLDLIEKLREERNLLPIYKKKAQDLQGLIADKEAEIKELKRDPIFTKIIELQIEYASWTHETKRLDGLLADPEGEAARREVEAQKQRVDDLEAQLDGAEERRSAVESELAEVEADHGVSLQVFKEKEKDLRAQQESTKDLAVNFKQMLQERKHVEHLQQEIESMELTRSQYEQELADISSGTEQLLAISQPPLPPLGRRAISQVALHEPLQTDHRPATASSFNTVRSAAARRVGASSLLASLAAEDRDADGLLSIDELAAALAKTGAMLPREQVEALAAQCPTFRFDPEGRVRWLDFLVVLDRGSGMSAIMPPSQPELPNTRPLRAACLRTGLGVEDLKAKMLKCSRATELEAVLAQELKMSSSAVAAFVTAWQQHGGSRGLLLALPLAEAAPLTAAARDAWLARCVTVCRAHRRELDESFTVWRSDMLLTERQFMMVCSDVMPELPEEDLDDLALFAGGGEDGDHVETVDAKELLRLCDSGATY